MCYNKLFCCVIAISYSLLYWVPFSEPLFLHPCTTLNPSSYTPVLLYIHLRIIENILCCIYHRILNITHSVRCRVYLLFIHYQIYHPGRNSAKRKPVQGTVLVHQHNTHNKYKTHYDHSTNKHQTIKLTCIKIVNKNICRQHGEMKNDSYFQYCNWHCIPDKTNANKKWMSSSINSGWRRNKYKCMTMSGHGIIGTISWKWDSICVKNILESTNWQIVPSGTQNGTTCGNNHHWIQTR